MTPFLYENISCQIIYNNVMFIYVPAPPIPMSHPHNLDGPLGVRYTGGCLLQSTVTLQPSNHTGDAMPQNGMNNEGRRRGMSRRTCKANGQVSRQVPGTGLVNGAVVHNGCPAADTRTSENTPAGTLNGTKSQCMVNGYINHGYKGKSWKRAPQRTFRKQGSTISVVGDASADGRVCSAGFPGGISVNCATSLDTVDLPRNSDQMAPEPSPSATAKKQRRRKIFRRKKRGTEAACLENSTPPLVPPKEEEDWENEIKEVTLTDWEKMAFLPYGPEDVLHFALRDLTLKERDTVAVDLPVTANYSPARHHPRPMQWFSYSIPTEQDQFADADE
ncbi:uncharacterized protein LOC123969770 isoform X2 [Micropterus dolomieu]|uniref:uncharacterized protein LOC123969770 isoform X2 n=1 Tax=Micropterus dolomieu TaxID=147949 RepID=UPI001E8E3607|nr:uncharacterized protein LOC123969770 isoform X2 [Micropterus dolomieu]